MGLNPNLTAGPIKDGYFHPPSLIISGAHHGISHHNWWELTLMLVRVNSHYLMVRDAIMAPTYHQSKPSTHIGFLWFTLGAMGLHPIKWIGPLDWGSSSFLQYELLNLWVRYQGARSMKLNTTLSTPLGLVISGTAGGPIMVCSAVKRWELTLRGAFPLLNFIKYRLQSTVH